MGKSFEDGEHIKDLRSALHLNQAEFGERFGVGQTGVSAWEVGDTTPPSDVWGVMAKLASGQKEKEWFLRRATGLEIDEIVPIVEQFQKERSAPAKRGEIYRISPFPVAEQTNEEGNPLLPLPAKKIPNPGSTRWFTLDESNASFPFAPGDIVVVDMSQTGRQNLVLRPLFNNLVLMEFTEQSVRQRVPQGFFTGQLLPRRGPPAFTWYAELAVLNQRLEVHRFTVGEWAAGHPVVQRDDPSAAAGYRQADAEEFALDEIRLYPGCKMVGPIIGWFRNPPAKTEERPKAPETLISTVAPTAVTDAQEPARILIASKPVGKGKERHYVPVVVEVHKESELRPEWTMKGPAKSKDGTENLYVGIDGHRLHFNAKTGAFIRRS